MIGLHHIRFEYLGRVRNQRLFATTYQAESVLATDHVEEFTQAVVAPEGESGAYPSKVPNNQISVQLGGHILLLTKLLRSSAAPVSLSHIPEP